MKTKVEVLPNGLTLVYIKTNKKYAKRASIILKFGGLNKEAILDGKKIKIKDGTAHFLEHLLIEHSPYGNLSFEYDKNHTSSNGRTSNTLTEYFFESTGDFEENLIKLITSVNKPVFTKDDVEKTKYAIIQERLARDDDKYYEFYEKTCSSLYENLKAPNVLGNVNDIKNMDYQDLKTAYDIFYNPSNQIITVNGNLSYNKVKKLILDTYQNLNIKKLNCQIPPFNLTDKIPNKKIIIKKDVPSNWTRLAFKINISKYSPIQKLKFDYYIRYYIDYIINELDEKIVLNKISNHSISKTKQDYNNYTSIWLTLQTDKSEEYIKLLFDALKNIKLPKEEFQTSKKRTLIDILLREESCYGQIGPFIDNIVSFDYYGVDDVELIESFNYEEFTKMIDETDFSNYAVIKLEKE